MKGKGREECWGVSERGLGSGKSGFEEDGVGLSIVQVGVSNN
jgi:hypothetical protein